MSACAAYGCTNRPQKKVPGITFHRFPSDKVLLKKWLIAIRRANFQPNIFSRLCSEHFSEDQIDRTSLACVRLRTNAVPHIFKGFLKDIKKKMKHVSPVESEIFSEDTNALSDESLSATEPKGIKRMITIEDSSQSRKEFSAHHPNSTIDKNKKLIVIEDKDSSADERWKESDEECPFSNGIRQCDDSDQSAEEDSKNGYSSHPNILRVIPADDAENISSSKLVSGANLDPDLIDALCASHEVGNSAAVQNQDGPTPPIILVQSNSLPRTANEMALLNRLQHSEMMNKKYRKKLKILQQQNRRQKVRIDKLTKQLNTLQNNQTSDEAMSDDSESLEEVYAQLLKYQRENENS